MYFYVIAQRHVLIHDSTATCTSKFPGFRPKPEEYHVVDGEDVDVARERRRVMTGDTHGDVLTIEGLSKVYKTALKKGARSVDNIALGVHKGECFGLLGVNGAGKTTTFKMLTGDETVTSGDAHLAGHRLGLLKA